LALAESRSSKKLESKKTSSSGSASS